MLFQKENIAVRYLQNEDKILLLKWLSNPIVLEFYEGRDSAYDLEKVNHDFYDNDADVEKCLVFYKGKAIGFVQYYPINRRTSPIKDFVEADITYGMDQCIGEPEYWNKGIGTLLVKAVVDYLVRERQATRVILDPHTWNIRAIRCYEKCGFEKVRILPKHEFHEGEFRDCWLMVYQVTN